MKSTLPAPANATRPTHRSFDQADRLGEGDALNRAMAQSTRKWADAGMFGADTEPEAEGPPVPSRSPQGPSNQNTRMDAFRKAVGSRYKHCSLDNFCCDHAGQREVVELLRGYIAAWEDHRRHGRGIMAIGGVGGGKDHLLVATAREIIQEHGVAVRWVSGPQLFSAARVHMGRDEAGWLSDYFYPPVLILSDPLPPLGGLTDHQAATVQLIVDERYRNRRPTWVTLNCKDSSEADKRMGASIVDRLTADALIVKCDWPSYRRPLD